ncbi:MAG: HrpA-like RNA helicase [Homavirus sp.]|uniref:HrpA-like RNA helicase n=1 Tax=Homavirus sp. TaxID=2487769 RepID=A0A3G5A8A5_9VIRU|nr:MAG: HrpA-like RNA helicase [Homavirus sp.]
MNHIGILDPNGINPNPLTNKPYSDDYKNLGNIWSKFPGYQKATEIIDSIKNYQVLLIVADTGSGKTVLVPKYALHAFDYKGKIGVTLPKQIVTKSAAEFSAKTLDVQLGKQVGYQYKGSPNDANSSDTLLLYATDGTIKSRLLNDPELKDFSCIIIDEAHERKIQIDFLLYLLRETLKIRPDFRLIIMSATINADIFATYFSEFKFKEICIAGQRNYPIESIFLKQPLEYKDVINEGFKIMTNIMENDSPSNTNNITSLANDIIFFVTSSNEAFELCKRLHTYISATCIDPLMKKSKIICNGDTYCVEVYSGMDPYKQNLAQDKNMYKQNKQFNYVRKVVIATNVAESSLTIDGIKYVIDCGYELKSSYDPNKRAKKLDRQLITVAQVKQRMGRSGRTEPGVCYHLYTKNDYENHMEKFPEPDIRVSDISYECLSLLGVQEINNVTNLIAVLTQFIEPPKEVYIKGAITMLMQLGLIKDGIITTLGRYTLDVGTNDTMSGIALTYSKIYMCSHEMIKILAMMEICNNNIVNFFSTPKTILSNTNDPNFNKIMNSLNEKYNKARKKFRHTYGDHLSLLKVYTEFYEHYIKYKNEMEKLNKWCYDRFLKINMLLKAVERAKKLKQKLYTVKIDATLLDKIDNIDTNMGISDRITKCLILGYHLNIANKTNNYYTTLTDVKTNIDQNSFLELNKTVPKNVYYTELFLSMGKSNINIVSKYI